METFGRRFGEVGRPAPSAARRPAGFTLLEVLLALGLTSLILVALAMTIDFHWRVLDVSRSHVEEAQLARTLLRRIADDLRGAVYSNANSAAQPASTGAAPPTGSPSPPSNGSGMGSASGSGTASGSTASATTATPHSVPGIYGDNYTLQVDVSRLPDPYQLQSQCALSADSQYAATWTDVKTVSYFVGTPQDVGLTGSQGPALSGTASPAPGGTGLIQGLQSGLMRCEAGRAAAVFAADHGGLSSAVLTGDLLAPEVAAIQFEYFDGSEWNDTWDSTQMTGLPMAVEVTVYITPMRSQRPRSSAYGGAAGNSPPDQQQAIPYSLLVALPMAQATQASGTSGTAAGTSTGGSAGSGTSGGSSASSKSAGSTAAGGSSKGTGGGSTKGTSGGSSKGGSGGSTKGTGGGRKG